MSEGIDLSKLPAPSIVEEPDFEVLLQELKDDLTAELPEVAEVLDLESEPLAKLLEVWAFRELLLRQQHNERARVLMLAYSSGAELDHIGVTYYQTERQLIDAGDPDAEPPVPPTYESDEEYRRRILLAWDSWSTAGPERGYVYHALTADEQVKDATAVTPAPTEVTVTVLSREGDGAAGQALLDTVAAAVNDEWVRPQTDLVTVQAATIQAYQVVATLDVDSGPDPELVRAEAEASVQAFVAEQHRLGVDLIRDALLARLYVDGVRKVTLTSPAADIPCDPSEAAYAESVEVTLG